ncbi:MAG: oxidoreductase [Planctomycetaceae bacterium]|nr:oxidoreductase [Planctomycetaceae bacterium]
MIPELHLPWLELSIVTPLVGAVVMSRLRNRDLARKVCIALCGAIFVMTVGEWADFNTLHTFEAHDHWDVIQFVFRKGVFVIDELSAPLLPLAALQYLMTVLSTLRTKVNRFSFAATLVSESILLATLSCREPLVLIALLAAATIPPWLELRARGRCTRVFTIHMATMVALLLAGQVLLYMNPAGGSGALAAGALLTLGALLRNGVVPLHCWMTDLFEKATFGTALLYVTPMAGAYAVMRLVLPVAPEWALRSIALVSLLTAVYAGGMALVQHEARRFFCYLFLSQSSLVLVGLELLTPIGLTGALSVWLSVGLSLLGFGLTLRAVESRSGRVSLDEYHGLYEHMPALASLSLLTGLAAIGFPGTVGFVGIELLIEGAVEVYPWTGIVVVVATALNGIAILLAYFRVFTGTTHHAPFPLSARLPERIAILILALLIIAGGLYPQPGVAGRYHAAVELIRHRGDAATPAPHSPPQVPSDIVEIGGSHVE